MTIPRGFPAPVSASPERPGNGVYRPDDPGPGITAPARSGPGSSSIVPPTSTQADEASDLVHPGADPGPVRVHTPGCSGSLQETVDLRYTWACSDRDETQVMEALQELVCS
jgi:hypothetical protein